MLVLLVGWLLNEADLPGVVRIKGAAFLAILVFMACVFLARQGGRFFKMSSTGSGPRALVRALAGRALAGFCESVGGVTLDPKAGRQFSLYFFLMLIRLLVFGTNLTPVLNCGLRDEGLIVLYILFYTTLLVRKLTE